jgi:hypothetical protein
MFDLARNVVRMAAGARRVLATTRQNVAANFVPLRCRYVLHELK